jgi:hypothetical protein
MAEVCSKKPLWYVTLPSHPEVCVHGQYRGGTIAAIYYEGTPAALIESGIATEEMLSGRRRKRFDAAGRHFRLQRSFRRIADGAAPVLHCKLWFSTPLEVIDQMPGAREAIYAGERLRHWYAAQADHPLTVDERRAADATADILARFARG